MNTIYVGNIPWEMNTSEFASLVREETQLKTVQAEVEIDEQTGLSRGFGFIRVKDTHRNQVISALQGYELGGRELILS